jgi:hypothetical protein
LTEIITGIQETYDSVPEEQVVDQVKIFIDEMITSGFIGIADVDSQWK